MHETTKLLSDVTVFAKYARYEKSRGKRESWTRLVDRNKAMHLKMYAHIEGAAALIEEAYKLVYAKKVLPSMRSLQFGGRPIELAHNRIYNCAYLPIDHPDAFSELMFLLLGGTGGGYSVQKRHVYQLPTVEGTNGKDRRYVVGDSIEGWSDAIKIIIEAYLYNKHLPRFDYSDIRAKGAELIKTGGKAPGPAPLEACVKKIEAILKQAVGRKLYPIEAHDICCHIADAVLVGGIRRAALISLFDRDDTDMLSCKQGEWWVDNQQRGRANNSAVLPRGEVTEEEFAALMKAVEASGCGEPGVYWTSNPDWGTNPCCEIGLRPFQFCNLCEVNASDVVDQVDLDQRCWAASVIGTLQAGYSDFHYLRPIWRETTEADALIGVGMTGIGSGAVLALDLEQAAQAVIAANEATAKLLGINPAARTTTVKPSGTSSLVLGSSSGIHAWHNDYYIRRMRLGKDEALYKYMAANQPSMVEDDFFNEGIGIASFPQKAPEGAIIRTESMEQLLERVRRFNLEWVRPGHRDGDNTHNVSCTISVKDHEWPAVTEWMWNNRNDYNGISVLPYNGGTYPQAPFEDITEEQFNALVANFNSLDIESITEHNDATDLQGEVACAGGGCEI